MSLGNKLRHLRSEKGYSQENVAEDLDITQAGYSKIESGKTTINTEQLTTLCKLFNVTPNFLLDYNEKNVIHNINHCNGVANGVSSQNVYINEGEILKEILNAFEKNNERLLEILNILTNK
jgi:transcriptional regulator with XRE-family HTH domain